MRIFLKKIWIWIKNFWYAPLLILVLILSIIFLPSKVSFFNSLLDSIELRHKKELLVIKKSEEEERSRRLELEKINEEKKMELEDKRSKDLKKIEKDQVSSKKKIIDDFRENRENLLKKVAKKYGFDYED